ncbi:NAD(+)/NADH kinase [Acidimicrobiia bacterium EGI L10123]|uniref:NAD(+)/NADH kinase n=1 Tax=Salinilacustrithrix flava TaxID=2957203 RepID=UPI003D7C1729|nr:NAD(+)/NADH kinase [Acidimicrobiia bacterium EGI L10123]
MVTAGFILHGERDRAASITHDLATWLLQRGHDVRMPTDDAERLGLGEHGVPEDRFADGLDVAVSLGGDGTMLRTVELVADSGIPVIGINVGQLGYLTEVDPAGARMAIKRYLSGAYEIEERMLLAARIEGRESSEHVALNEAVIEKTPSGHTVRLAVSVDGEYFTTYAADGLIVATPTGSTAYSFSARGPIVAPMHRCLVLTPVSPHMLFDRTLVLDPHSTLHLEVVGHRPATVSADGRNLGTLHPGDALSCTASPRTARLVTFGEHDFLAILKTKFGLSDR